MLIKHFSPSFHSFFMSLISCHTLPKVQSICHIFHKHVFENHNTKNFNWKEMDKKALHIQAHIFNHHTDTRKNKLSYKRKSYYKSYETFTQLISVSISTCVEWHWDLTRIVFAAFLDNRKRSYTRATRQILVKLNIDTTLAAVHSILVTVYIQSVLFYISCGY